MGQFRIYLSIITLSKKIWKRTAQVSPLWIISKGFSVQVRSTNKTIWNCQNLECFVAFFDSFSFFDWAAFEWICTKNIIYNKTQIACDTIYSNNHPNDKMNRSDNEIDTFLMMILLDWIIWWLDGRMKCENNHEEAWLLSDMKLLWNSHCIVLTIFARQCFIKHQNRHIRSKTTNRSKHISQHIRTYVVIRCGLVCNINRQRN